MVRELAIMLPDLDGDVVDVLWQCNFQSNLFSDWTPCFLVQTRRGGPFSVWPTPSRYVYTMLLPTHFHYACCCHWYVYYSGFAISPTVSTAIEPLHLSLAHAQ